MPRTGVRTTWTGPLQNMAVGRGSWRSVVRTAPWDSRLCVARMLGVETVGLSDKVASVLRPSGETLTWSVPRVTPPSAPDLSIWGRNRPAHLSLFATKLGGKCVAHPGKVPLPSDLSGCLTSVSPCKLSLFPLNCEAPRYLSTPVSLLGPCLLPRLLVDYMRQGPW